MSYKKEIHIFYFILFLTLAKNIFSQTPGEWTWMSGDTIPSTSGVFGVQGVPNAANKPPSLYEPCEWTDKNGNFWLFGGQHTISCATCMYAALWKFDPITNQWTWMKGPNTTFQFGVYGTKGIPSSANYPGSRAYGSATWTDNSGNLWLFGGIQQNAPLNDLWMYNVSTNQWTWMKGSNSTNSPGSYGVQGVSSPTNEPPARDETSATWTDNNGNLWLYGGIDVNLNTFSDLWKYNISTNEWTWMQGFNSMNIAAVYGTQGVAAPSNTPGGKMVYASWVDKSNNLLLFGGSDQTGLGSYTNALWKYTIAINQWTWIQGPNTINNIGNYGMKCIPASTNLPRSRYENRARVVDTCGNLWNFGGASQGVGYLNDLWHYNVSTQEWTWVSGDSIFILKAFYGLQGISNPNNKLGGRIGSVAWLDKQGYIWIFGGADWNYSTHNDLFRYVPDTACVKCTTLVFSLNITSNNVSCYGNCNGNATANPVNGTTPYTYAWSNSQTSQSITGLCSGNYSVVITDAASATCTATVNITQPPLLSLSLSSTNATCGNNDGLAFSTINGGTAPYSYIWSTVPVQTSANSTGLSQATYTITVTDSLGCSIADTINIKQDSFPAVVISGNVTICLGNNATLAASGGGNYLWSNGSTSSIIYISPTTTATYSVFVSSGSCVDTASASVMVNPNPIATIVSYIPIVEGQSITLTASGGENYFWNTGSTDSLIVVSPSTTTFYCITIFDLNNCTDSACVTITVEDPCVTFSEFFIPNAFSPNDDLENDSLKVYYKNTTCIKSYKLFIYNRWGELVFETADPNINWDGSYYGVLESGAVFSYYLEAILTTGKEIIKSGNISIIK